VKHNAHAHGSSRACRGCERRSWLLSTLAGPLDYQCRDRERLLALLGLSDEDLVQAVGGRRRSELRGDWTRFDSQDVCRPDGVEAVCRHDPSYPTALRDPGSPWMLNVSGGVERLRSLTTAPTVAVIGSSRASDYGMEMAKGIARGLAASGVTITSGFSDGIAIAALAGALEARGATVTVMPGGLDAACPARRRSLYERTWRAGCAVAELPCGYGSRRFAQAGGERILVRLAQLIVVVEAEDSVRELFAARVAQALGRTVAAVPGRVTSRASSGPHALLAGGARLVRGPADALELLCGVHPRTAPGAARARVALQPWLQGILDAVGVGRDTPDKLTRAGGHPADTLLALSELELMGLLARGDGGRYVPRYSTGEQRLTVY
jgi:DNA processing protein